MPPARMAWVPARPRSFGPLSRRLARRFVEAALPSAESGAPAGREVIERVLDGMEGALPYFPRSADRAYRFGLVALEGLAVALGPRRRPFSTLSTDGRREFLTQLLEGHDDNLRLFVRALNLVVGSVYYSMPEVWEALDYHPHPWFESRIARHEEVARELDHPVE